MDYNYRTMKLYSPLLKSIVWVVLATICFSACNNEKQTVVDESVRLINKATAQMQDLNELQVKHLKDIPEDLQDSLALLQNRHPDVVLSEEDNKQIQSALAKFTEAQDNAIKVCAERMQQLQQSVAKLNGGEGIIQDSVANSDEDTYSYATFF